MKKSEQIKTKMAQVHDILTRLPETRDNDRELVAAYWRAEQPMLFGFRNADAVLRAFITGELANPDDITRTRRLVQAKHPELRGTKKPERTLLEEEVRENINTQQVSDEFENLIDP